MDILMSRWNQALGFCLLLGSPGATALAVPDDTIRPQVASLVSSPGRCVLKSGQTQCQMTVNLIWEAPLADNYCLWHQTGAQPIKCWQQQWQGTVKIKFSASEKTTFMLKAESTANVLVQTAIPVAGSYKQRKRAQRRKRGFWRMF